MTSLSVERSNQRHRTRLLIDQLTRWLVRLGGVAVIVAISLIFGYLLWVVLPLLGGASLHPADRFVVPGAGAGKTLLLGLQPEGEIAYRVTDQGSVVFFLPHSGRVDKIVDLHTGPLRSAMALDASRMLLSRTDGGLSFASVGYEVSFNGAARSVTPSAQLSYGDTPLFLPGRGGAAPPVLAVQADHFGLTLAVATETKLQLLHWGAADSTEQLEESDSRAIITLDSPATNVMIGARGQLLYVAQRNGWLSVYDLADPAAPQPVAHQPLVTAGVATATAMLLGGYSLLVAADSGQLVQWTLPQGVGPRTLIKLRAFDLHAAITTLLPESRRRGLVAIDRTGAAHLLHTTSERVLNSASLGAPPSYAVLATRADQMLVQQGDTLLRVAIDNRHPEVSFHSLWQRVWYEGYDEPTYNWQSSSADEDFEPKFSLMPLAFGTLKGAFYALLFALPTAVLGAIYTGYFMAPAMRAWVKPAIEVMAALPTVILGFIAGLWLAPLIEANLVGVVGVFVAVPTGILLVALLWHMLPEAWTRPQGSGWYAALLAVPIVFLTWFAILLGAPIEEWLFGGDVKSWLLADLGIEYQQRNCFVVGIAMGLAVIPTIFSIAEDAIFSVPRHLTQGSLALGATPWQTLSRVVLLTASPGIFSAAMIGMGRAVGETMIVLMATGNTPIMNMSMFQGMRTFAANIAVEMPESAVNSSHYRILFLAALVLFALTFTVNTVAEIVRQRLRARYGNL